MEKYRLHVVSLAHTQTTSEYICCAYTQKVIKFCQMMMSIGNDVILYGGEENEAECTEFVTCVKKKFSADEYTAAPFDVNADHWKEMNANVIFEILKRKQDKDFICVIAGLCQKPISDAFPELMTVEFGIGYGGVFSKYKVFESYAWQNVVYGSLYGAHAADGNFFDTVIPNYFNVNDFQFSSIKDDYFLFVGRIIERKGIKIAQQVCEKIGKRLIIAGSGPEEGYGEFVGTVNAIERGNLMKKAKAVFTPSIYLEPFCGVHIEAMLCGTPVITTNFGVFSETVINGFNGFRCDTMNEFIQATQNVENLIGWNIRKWAINKFSTRYVRRMYQSYFDRLFTLWGKGWYQ